MIEAVRQGDMTVLVVSFSAGCHWGCEVMLRGLLCRVYVIHGDLQGTKLYAI